MVLMVFVMLEIRCGARVLKLWYGFVVPSGSSVANVYTDYKKLTIINKTKGLVPPTKSGVNSHKLAITTDGVRVNVLGLGLGFRIYG